MTPPAPAKPRRVDKFKLFKMLGYEPHGLQAEVHASAASRRVLACGVRWGKTKAAAMEAMSAALLPSEPMNPRRGWICAPSYELADKVFREIALIAREKLPQLIRECKDHERMITLTNLGGGMTELRGKTADNPVSLLGEGLDFLIVDEAARLRPDIWDRYLTARLLDKKGWALLISTPYGKGWFYDAWRAGQRHEDGWASWNAPSWSNPHLDAADIEMVRKRIPEMIFRQEYGAEFIEGAGQVFRNVRDLATGEWREPEERETYSAGLDLARVADYTVLVIMDSQRRVVYLDRFTRLDWALQVSRISAACKRYNDAFVYVDSTGAGEPVFEALLEAGIRADGYAFTNASKGALVNNMSMMLEQRILTLPRPELAPELIDEMEAFEFSVTDAGTVRTGAPSGMHDDTVCAVMLACWGARDVGEFEVQEV